MGEKDERAKRRISNSKVVREGKAFGKEKECVRQVGNEDQGATACASLSLPICNQDNPIIEPITILSAIRQESLTYKHTLNS